MQTKTRVRVLALAAVLLACVFLAAGCGNNAQDDTEIGFGDDTLNFSQPSSTPDQSGAALAPVTTPDPAAPSASATPAEPTPTSAVSVEQLDGTSKATPEPKRTYEEYRNLNSDVIGWINIPGTEVDYPLLKASDNEYYLTRNAEKASSDYGAIFMDYRCTKDSKHIIIHGHNMKNGSMFGSLHNYSLKEFYDAHREIKIKFGDKEYTYKIFATYTVDAADALYMAVDQDIPNDESFAEFMNQLAAKSRFATDITIQPTDHVVTLSTCNRVDYKNGREVVHAVRV